MICYEQNQHFAKSVMVLVGNTAYQQWKSFYDKLGMKVIGQHYWDILLSEKCQLLSNSLQQKLFYFVEKQHIIALCMQHSPTAAAKTQFHCS